MKNILLVAGVLGLLVGVATPLFAAQTTYAVDRFGDGKDDDCSATFLTFPTWYHNLPREGCNIKTPNTSNGVSTFIFTIVANVIEIALQIVAYAAVGFIIYGGFKYLTAAGDANRITAGRKMITNAIIGLVISFASIAVVNLVAGSI